MDTWPFLQRVQAKYYELDHAIQMLFKHILKKTWTPPIKSLTPTLHGKQNSSLLPYCMTGAYVCRTRNFDSHAAWESNVP